MNWLLFILRVVFGLPREESGDPQRVAIRPDGSTTTVRQDAPDCQSDSDHWNWLLPHSFWRNRFLIVPSVMNFLKHTLTRKFSSDHARPRTRHKYRR